MFHKHLKAALANCCCFALLCSGTATAVAS
jgi:hypothetical protein